MSDTIQVEAARIPDRNKLVELLREHGLDAQPENEVSIIVPCDDDGGELFSYVEGLIMISARPSFRSSTRAWMDIRPPVGYFPPPYSIVRRARPGPGRRRRTVSRGRSVRRAAGSSRSSETTRRAPLMPSDARARSRRR